MANLQYYISLTKQKRKQKVKNNNILYKRNPNIKAIIICTRIAFNKVENCLSCKEYEKECDKYIEQYPEIKKRLQN